jgi:hypothetical protein
MPAASCSASAFYSPSQTNSRSNGKRPLGPRRQGFLGGVSTIDKIVYPRGSRNCVSPVFLGYFVWFSRDARACRFTVESERLETTIGTFWILEK